MTDMLTTLDVPDYAVTIEIADGEVTVTLQHDRYSELCESTVIPVSAFQVVRTAIGPIEAILDELNEAAAEEERQAAIDAAADDAFERWREDYKA